MCVCRIIGVSKYLVEGSQHSHDAHTSPSTADRQSLPEGGGGVSVTTSRADLEELQTRLHFVALRRTVWNLLSRRDFPKCVDNEF